MLELARSWVATPIIYIGKAKNLRRRLAEYRRHGEGAPVGHWGGRAIWQLADATDLLVLWLETPNEEPRDVERAMIEEFQRRHGTLPFANRRR